MESAPGSPGPARLVAHGAGNRAVGAYLRREARRAEGQALAPSLRAEMESHLGADLSGVRIHTSTAAAESANALRARAFTVGRDVVFASGEYRPADGAGRALLAHELTHTVQQARGGPAPAGSDDTERTAAESAALLARGARPAQVTQGSAVGVARQAAGAQTEAKASEKPDSLGRVGDFIVDELTGLAAGSGVQQQMLKAAVIGFIAELLRQFEDPTTRAEIHAGATELAKPSNQKQLIAAYYGGAVASLVSPLTDLLGLFVLQDHLRAFSIKLGAGVLKGEIDLIEEATGLGKECEAFTGSVKDWLLDTIKNHPEELFFFSGLQAMAVRKAGEAGRTGARGVVAAVSGKEDKAAKPPETAGQILTTHTEAEKAGAASFVESKATRARQAIFHTHPQQLGYDVGHAVGSAISQVLIAVFTEGVGNAITKIAAEIGRVAPMLARGAEALAEIGKIVTGIEQGIGALVEGTLGALKGLGRILGPFRALMKRLQSFLGKVAGKAARLESAAVHAAETAAAHAAETAAPKLTPKAPKVVRPGEPRPKAPPKSQQPRPKAAEPAGRAANDNDIPLRKGEPRPEAGRAANDNDIPAPATKEPAPKTAPGQPEPPPQSQVQPVAQPAEDIVERKMAAGAEGFEPAPKGVPPTVASKTPPKGSPPLKVVPPPKGTVAPKKPIPPKAPPPAPKGTKGTAKKQTAATKEAELAERAEKRAERFKHASNKSRFDDPLNLRERTLIVEHLAEGQPLTGAMKDRLRGDARAWWKTATQGKGLQPGRESGYQVHHIVPLEFAHQFPGKYPNDISNLVLMDDVTHNQWHRVLSSHQRTEGRRLTIEEILKLEQETFPSNKGGVFVIKHGKVVPAL